jgi:hypothetical protein
MIRNIIYINLLLAVFFAPALYAIDSFHIDSDRDSRFLPYQFTSTQSNTYTGCRKSISSPIHVLRPGSGTGDSALYARGYNPPMNEDVSGSIFVRFHPGKVAVESPTFMTIKDFTVFYDSEIGQEAIVSGCYVHDSAFIERFIPFPRQRDTLFLATGLDYTGNGQWEPNIDHIATLDYDYDGVQELFFYVNPVRDRSRGSCSALIPGI